MNETDVLDLFRHSGALLEGHFRLSSGLHSNRYLQSALVLQHPDFAEQLGRALAASNAHLQPTAVLSPALGGIVIGQEVGRALHVRALFAERQDSQLTLRRGFTLAPADRVLIVEDVITTGGSTRETAAVAEHAGATVIGAGAIIDRGSDPSRLNIPLRALVTMKVEAWQPDACPLCAQGLPVVKPGSRA
jgi:orotate phosphoribosyltransferase